MKRILGIVFLLILTSCSMNKKNLYSDFEKLEVNQTGALITIDLRTEGLIKRGNSCSLIISQEGVSYKTQLKEGVYNYALPLVPGLANIKELNCGAFYYYKIKDEGSQFNIENNTITYLGTIDFELKEKGKMVWGPKTKSTALLEEEIESMGLSTQNIKISPLKI